jgi:hypothetical protein
MRTCSKCGLEKDENQYIRRANGNLRRECKTCKTIMNKQWYIKNKDHYKTHNKEYYKAHQEHLVQYRRDYVEKFRTEIFARTYNITPEEYHKIVADSNNICAICRKKCAGHGYEELHIDHDHDTGLVRGMLCFTCNSGIGFLKDNMDLLASAIIYLTDINSRQYNPTPEGMCRVCEEIKLKSEFKKTGSVICKKCRVDRYYKDDYVNSHYLRSYNITEKQYLHIIDVTDNKCQICGGGKKLRVDHCHKTNTVRGLLCNDCNSGIGSLKEDIELIQTAIEYLKGNNYAQKEAA